jgi:Fe-Mn family superoxide dismutase
MQQLPVLPYSLDSLSPVIDAQTMALHHGKHHQAYITKYNAAVENTPFENQRVSTVLKNLDAVPDAIRQTVRNNGGGHVNHSFFWTILTSNPEDNTPQGDIVEHICRCFGAFDQFKNAFANAALNQFGSGWAWLVMSETAELSVMATPNQDCPVMTNHIPLLGLDVWEHAYYLTYQNRRLDYINAFWNIINWAQISHYYTVARRGFDSSFLV